MTHRLTGLLAATSLALAGCATTGTNPVLSIFNLADSYDDRLEGHVEAAIAADSPEARAESVTAIAGVAADANGKADAAVNDGDARLVWLSIAANGYDQAALLTPAGIDVVKSYRMEVLAATSGLSEACSDGTSDGRLGYRCASGTMIQVLNGSETSLAEFSAAIEGGDLEAAALSAQAYGVAVTQDWPTYQDAISEYPLGDQDLSPISERQIGNACAFNGAAQSGSPTWLNSMRTLAQGGDEDAKSARDAYVYAAADVAEVLAVEPAGTACEMESDDRTPACAGQFERGLTFFCNEQSGR
ncbi:MAG: hypothetical protein AAF829_03490 [Pseudomonadota bacterium]